MDGVALSTTRLRVVDSALAVPRPDVRPIATGEPIPADCDAVVPTERLIDRGDLLMIRGEVEAGDHVRRTGEELKTGECALRAGTPLGPAAIGLLTALGVSTVVVHRQPRVALLVTGDEVVPLEDAIQPGHVRDANGPMIERLVVEAGACLIGCEYAPDDPGRIADALGRLAAEADLVCTSGGASIGRKDHLLGVLAGQGRLLFRQLAIRPGRPTSLGVIDGRLVFVLPGNPLAALVGFEAVIRVALRRMVGDIRPLRRRVSVTAGEPIPHRAGRLEFVPVRLTEVGEAVVAGGHRSAMLSGAAMADGFALLPAERGSVAAGGRLEVELW
jgi:molybdopterin molybdotransferase